VHGENQNSSYKQEKYIRTVLQLRHARPSKSNGDYKMAVRFHFGRTATIGSAFIKDRASMKKGRKPLESCKLPDYRSAAHRNMPNFCS